MTSSRDTIYFFEDEHENQVTMDTKGYIALIQTNFIPTLRRKRGVDMNEQDGPPLYCSDRSLEFLRWYFPSDRFLLRHHFGHLTLLISIHLTSFYGLDPWKQSPEPGSLEGQQRMRAKHTAANLINESPKILTFV